jgi:excisionase family DNA binding protein
MAHHLAGRKMMSEVKETYLSRLAAQLEPVTDAADMLGVSRQYVLSLIQQGKLESVKLGRDHFVSSLSLQEFMDARAEKKMKVKRTERKTRSVAA